MQKGFVQYDKRGKRRVLGLKKTLYGISQIPRYFLKYLTLKLIVIIILHTNNYPCLFIGDKVISIVYVDDLLFWVEDESDMHYL